MNIPLPGTASPTEIIEREEVFISFYEEYSLILVHWKCQIIFEERKYYLRQVLALIHQFQVKNLLICDQHIYFLSPEDKSWIETVWVDSTSLSSLVKFGIVFLENYDLLIHTTEFMYQLQKQFQTKGKIQFRRFVSFPAALAWLEEAN